MKREARSSLLMLAALSLSVSGCNQAPSENDLLGAWVPINASCQSGAGWFFEKAGQYGFEGGEGIWSLEGDQLTIRTTGFYEDDGIRAADETEVYKIVNFGENLVKLSKSSNEIIELKRCNSGAEGEAETSGSNGGTSDESSQGIMESIFSSNSATFLSCYYDSQKINVEYKIEKTDSSNITIGVFDPASNKYLDDTVFFSGVGSSRGTWVNRTPRGLDKKYLMSSSFVITHPLI